MKILLTGADGQLGRELIRRCPEGCFLTPMSRSALDITDSAACTRALRDCSPDWVINAAAYTNVEQAEDEAETAMRVNGDGPFHLANAVRKSGARLLHISTDFVFDGKLRRPYRPDDLTNPLSSYGRSKLAGEQAVLSVLGHDALIIRTSWLYSAVGKNFLNTILRLLREKDSLNVVNDQFGSPTSVMSLVSAIYASVKADVKGLHHWCDEGIVSWHGFARAIQHEALNLGMLIKFKEINPVPGSEYKTKAVRPAWSALDCSTLCEAIKYRTNPWLDCLKLTLQQLKEKKTS